MKERPILMSAPMVRAIIEGRKTQTRRLLRPHRLVADAMANLQSSVGWSWASGADGWGGLSSIDDTGGMTSIPLHCPYGWPTDRLWVREAVRWEGGPRAIYEADDTACVIDTWPWKRRRLPGIFLPRGASRGSLEITEVRVQRLQEISEDDARAEGVEPYTPPHGHISPDQRVPGPGFERCRLGDQPHRLPFADLWDNINGKRAPWAGNPWVWALSFRVLP